MLWTNKSEFVRVAAPNLPPSPALYVNEKTHQAFVVLRLATWRSWGYGHLATCVLIWAIAILVGLVLWQNLVFLEDPVMRGSFTALGFALTFAVCKSIFHAIFDGFFARQLFAVRTRFWFTPELIAFCSSFYHSGVAIDRLWRNIPVACRFDTCSDIEAAEAGAITSPFAFRIQQRRQTACNLRLIVGIASSHSLTANAFDMPALRAIPVCECDQRDAAQIATVLSAASAVTSKSVHSHEGNAMPRDIDLR